MDKDPRRFIAALRTSHDRLTAFAADLDEAALSRTSMCSDWPVAGVLGHLGSGAEIGLANLEANLAGHEPPGSDANLPIWERWDALAPREAAEHFVEFDRRFVEAYEQLDGDRLASMLISLPFLPAPVDVATALGFRLNEHALHGWDVFATFDPAATLDPTSVELLIDRLPAMVALIGRFTPRETRPASPVTISITTAEPARRYELELGDALELRPANGQRAPDSELALPAEALLRLVAGRLRQDRAHGDLEPTGELAIADLRRAFPGY